MVGGERHIVQKVLCEQALAVVGLGLGKAAAFGCQPEITADRGVAVSQFGPVIGRSATLPEKMRRHAA